jgi:hypothetical protein
MRTLRRLAAVSVTLLGLLLAVAGPASASLTTGYKAIASSGASGVAGYHVGFGPGWLALTFDTNGSPHGPVIGYLLHDGVAGAVGNDHFQVSRISTKDAASVTTPFAAGYAYGNFVGCAWSYLDDGGDELAAASGSGTDCTPPNHTTAIFCTNHAAVAAQRVGGSGEGEPGVWRNTSNHRASIRTGGCDVYANVGSAAIYSGGAATPKNLIAHVNSGTVQVRYVIKHGDYVMANLGSDGSPQLPNFMQWGFYPRSCLAA